MTCPVRESTTETAPPNRFEIPWLEIVHVNQLSG
jgi:hypothetical protein